MLDQTAQGRSAERGQAQHGPGGGMAACGLAQLLDCGGQCPARGSQAGQPPWPTAERAGPAVAQRTPGGTRPWRSRGQARGGRRHSPPMRKGWPRHGTGRVGAAVRRVWRDIERGRRRVRGSYPH